MFPPVTILLAMKNTENITNTSDTDEAFLMSARWALEGIALPIVAAVGLLGRGTGNRFIITNCQ